MKLLVMGGTVFVGRHMVEAALARGHEVTLFNRGRQNKDLFPGVEKLQGDRNTDLSALKGKHWDAILDTSAYLPKTVGLTLDAVADSVEHYVYVSSISVYADNDTTSINEEAPLQTMDDETVAKVEARVLDDYQTAGSYGRHYGPLKVRCEQMLEKRMPGKALVIRPGLIVGPHDYTDRFTYWLRRTAQEEGSLLAPEGEHATLAYIDARDLAQWTVAMVEQKQMGTYNASGRKDTFGPFLKACQEVTQSRAQLKWLDEAFLIENGVRPWVDLPLWLGSESGMLEAMDDGKANAQGLTYRPVVETMTDTYQWLTNGKTEFRMANGLSAERETQLLESWNQR